MNSIVRHLAAFAVGWVATLFLGFAVLARAGSEGAVKQENPVTPNYAKLSASFFTPFPISRPRSCFCDEDCFAALLKEQERKRRLHLTFNWQPQPAQPGNDIREIDLDGLKKILQRDPNDTRPLLLNFWATWCDPCREEFPDLVKLDADYRNKGLNFIAVSLDDITDIKSEVPKFLNEMKATMPVVLLNVNDPEPAIKIVDATWDGQLPATFLYDKNGKVIFKHFGKIKPEEVRAAIDKQIGSKQ